MVLEVLELGLQPEGIPVDQSMVVEFELEFEPEEDEPPLQSI